MSGRHTYILDSAKHTAAHRPSDMNTKVRLGGGVNGEERVGLCCHHILYTCVKEQVKKRNQKTKEREGLGGCGGFKPGSE